jgi:hypothetical protein
MNNDEKIALAAKMAEVMHNAGFKAGFFNYPYEKVAAHGVEKYGVLAKAILEMPEFSYQPSGENRMIKDTLASMLKVLFPNEAWDTYVRASACILHEHYGKTDDVPDCLKEFSPSPALVSVWHSGCRSLSPDSFDELEKALIEISHRQQPSRDRDTPNE